MQTENKFFEDFVKMANGFAGTMAGMGREAEVNAKDKIKQWLGGFDFVSREEFEAVKAMAAAARDEVAALKAQAGPARSQGGAAEAHVPTSYDTPAEGEAPPGVGI